MIYEDKPLIYAADDELNIRRLIQTFLQKEGYQVEVFENGELLLEAFGNRPADLVILDVMMPGKDGLSVCYELRQMSAVPVIMLTAKDTEADYVAGITLGSDDYFTKPVSPTVLTMRVKAILRRVSLDQQSRNNGQEHIQYGDVTADAGSKTVHCQGKVVPLTMTEFNMLHYLMEKQGNAVSREELLNKVWGYGSLVETRATDDTVKRLRKKLLEAESQIVVQTVWGFGFKLVGKGE